MTERQERIRYYSFAAFVGVLLLLNWVGVFTTVFGIHTAIFITLLAGYKTFQNSIAALLERRISAHVHRLVHRRDCGAFGWPVHGGCRGDVHRPGR